MARRRKLYGLDGVPRCRQGSVRLQRSAARSSLRPIRQSAIVWAPAAVLKVQCPMLAISGIGSCQRCSTSLDRLFDPNFANDSSTVNRVNQVTQTQPIRRLSKLPSHSTGPLRDQLEMADSRWLAT
jgi:hypothetical protein